MEHYPQLEWLESQGATFVKLARGKKTPVERHWQTTPRSMADITPHLDRGGNVGLLCGTPSGGICALDFDRDFPKFVATFPAFRDAPHITRADAPERGKVLIKVVGAVPAPKKWKPVPHDAPYAEFLSTGNQALVPPSLHPGGAPFVLSNPDLPIPELSPSDLDTLWFTWTRTRLVEPAAATPPLERDTPQTPYAQLREDIRARFDLVRYAAATLKAETKTESDGQVRILGQGGLIINPAKRIWTTFAEDGKTGGDCFDLVAFLTYHKTRVKGDEWHEVFRLAADFAGVILLEAYSHRDTPVPLEDEDGNVYSPPPASPAMKIYSITDMWAVQAGVQKAWDGWMLMNNITLIGGVPSVGKSVLMLAIVAGFLSGEWPDGTPVPPEMAGRNVVYCLPEGFGEQTEILKAWGLDQAELSQRIFIPAIPMPGNPEQPNYIFKLDSEEGKRALEYYCEQVQPGLVVIDGLRAAMSGEESSSGDIEKFTTPLVSLANRYNCVVLLSHHLTKGKEKASQDGDMPSSDWFRGSGHLLAACRSAWIIDQPDPAFLSKRRITLVKASSGPKGIQMAYEMDDPADGVRFTKSIPLPAPKSKKETAKRFILQMLRRDKMTHDHLFRACQNEGLDISEATFRDARVQLSNEHRIVQIVVGKAYYWALPTYEDDDTDYIEEVEDAMVF